MVSRYQSYYKQALVILKYDIHKYIIVSLEEDSWNKPPASLIKPKAKVKVGGRADSLPISIKQVKVIKKRKPLADRLTTVKAINVKPKEVEPNIIKIENNKQVVNNASTKTKRQV